MIFTADCSYDDRRLAIRAPVIVRALISLFDEACDEIRRLLPPEELERRRKAKAPKSLAVECGRMCRDAAFRTYLRECHDLPDATDEERVNTKVRFILAIASRAELDTDPDAAVRWQDLRDAYYRWKAR